LRLPVAEAMGLVRTAGGVAAWAHPPYDEGTRETLAGLRRLGLQAVEVYYPGFRPARTRHLSQWAAEMGLAVTGGSDCHGPGQPRRAPGACSVTRAELHRLRQLAMD
jgi:predicted metal-dependent phosphoesterase TrpH